MGSPAAIRIVAEPSARRPAKFSSGADSQYAGCPALQSAARAAAAERQHDMIALRDSRHGAARLDHDACALVTEHVGQRQRQDLLDDGDVGVTDACRHELDEHFVGSRSLEAHLLDRERRVRSFLRQPP